MASRRIEYQYVDISDVNNTDVDQHLIVDDPRQNAIFDNASEWTLGVKRFGFPTNAISTVIDKSKAYKLYISFWGNYRTYGAAYQTFSHSMNMNIPVTTFTSFLELANRTLLVAYRNLCNDTYSVSSTHTYNTGNLTKNFVISGGTMPFTGYIQFKIRKTDETTKESYLVKLIAPDGNSCIIASNKDFVEGINYTIEDAGHYNIMNQNTDSGGTFSPQEPFTSLCNSPHTGTWIVEILPLTVFDPDVTFHIELMIHQNHWNTTGIDPVLSEHVPYFAHNENTNKCELNVPERFHMNGFSIGLSDSLEEMLKFRVNVRDSVNYIDMPQQQYESPYTGVITIPQENTSIWRIVSYPSKFLIKTNMPIRNVVTSGSNSHDSLLESFLIDPSAFSQEGGSMAIYNASGEPRFHNLISSQPLTNINMSVYVEFADGSIEPLVLRPGESYDILLEFRRVVDE